MVQHHHDLAGLDLLGQLLLEVGGDALLGRLDPHAAVRLEQAHALLGVHPQQELALRLFHLQEGPVGPQGHPRLDLHQRFQGDALPGLHLLAHPVVPGGDAVLRAHAGKQVQQIVHALAGSKPAPQLDDGRLQSPEPSRKPGTSHFAS